MNTPLFFSAARVACAVAASVLAVPASAGLVAGNRSLTSSNVDLSSGTFNLDWAYWEGNAGTSSTSTSLTKFDQKASPAWAIGSLSPVGTVNYYDYGGSIGTTYTWSDGRNAASGSGDGLLQDFPQAVDGNGFRLTVPADTTKRRLHFHLGANNASATFRATLSDGSASSYVNTVATGAATTYNYTIDFAADSPGQTLTLEWTRNSATGNGANVYVSAAQLLGLSPPAPPPLTVHGGKVLHLDASTITGVSDGARVATWNDLSTANNDATQTTVSNRPQFVEDGGADFGHRPVVRFDGNDLLTATGVQALNDLDQATVFAIVKTTNATANQVALVSETIAGEASFPRIQAFDVTGTAQDEWLIGAEGNAWRYGVETLVNADQVYFFAATFDGTQPVAEDRLSMQVDALLPTLGTGPAGTISPTLGEIDTLFIGSWLNSGFNWQGDIAEILVYNQKLTQAEFNAVGWYLQEKYNLQNTNFSPPVPEPSTFVLVAMLFVGVASRWRRRNTIL